MDKQIGHSIEFYLKSLIVGASACSLTHLFIFPFQKITYKIMINTDLLPIIFDPTIKQKILSRKLIGWTPIFFGYSIYGSIKFGLYELLKDAYKNILGLKKAKKFKKIGWSIASGLAELFANTFLYPWLEIKRIMQLSRTNPQYPSSCLSSFIYFKQQSNVGYVFSRMIELWVKQIPSTMIKFVTYEWLVQRFYEILAQKNQQSYHKGLHFSVIFGSGFLAGVFPSFLNHPSDILVSKAYSQPCYNSSFSNRVTNAYKKIGFYGLWKGLGHKATVQGILFGFQLLIYDGCRIALDNQREGKVF